jgi:hypothetical protein
MACLPPLELPTATPQPTATATILPSATIDWFPATETPTPTATVPASATPDLRAGIGDLLFEDAFVDGAPWSLRASNLGSAALGSNELTLALLQPGGYLSTERIEPSLRDFYLEITMAPSICVGQDEYGLLLRVQSNADFYRLGLSCDGQVRLDRVVGGTGASLQTWLFSAAVPSAAPSQVRVAVWAVGRELRIFIGDQFHFSVSDPLLPSGRIGLFTRAAGDTAVTVNFSDLSVWQVQAAETGTAP